MILGVCILLFNSLLSLTICSRGTNALATADKVFLICLLALLIVEVWFVCAGINGSADGDNTSLGGVLAVASAPYLKIGALGDKDDCCALVVEFVHDADFESENCNCNLLSAVALTNPPRLAMSQN